MRPVLVPLALCFFTWSGCGNDPARRSWSADHGFPGTGEVQTEASEDADAGMVRWTSDAGPHDEPCATVQCGANATCANRGEQASCVCNEGFVHEDGACVPVTPTEMDPCLNVHCSGHGRCVVHGSSPVCECEPGYVAVELACDQEERDPCAAFDCGVRGTCLVAEGNARCDCDTGYHAEGNTCVSDANPCLDQRCSDHGDCTVTDGTAVCECERGYRAEGLECVEDPCANVHCGHGRCIADSSPWCECDPGYQFDGSSCVLPGTLCNGVDCNGHGTCHEEDLRPVCDCDEGYRAIGLACMPTVCDGIYCEVGGTCVSVNDAPYCECPEGSLRAGLTCVRPSSCDELDEPCLPGRALRKCYAPVGDAFFWREDAFFYRTDDEKRFDGLSSALGYCKGETSGEVDGECSGLAEPCSSLDVGACEQHPQCHWNGAPPGGRCEGEATCRKGYDPAGCHGILGCYWSELEADRRRECVALNQACVRGRRYRGCAENDGFYYQFEDGIMLFSANAAQGYCSGETLIPEDGDCVGIPDNCSEYTSAEACSARSSCAWNGSRCVTGTQLCYTNRSSAACGAARGCQWTPSMRGDSAGCVRVWDPIGCTGWLDMVTCRDENLRRYFRFNDGKRLYGEAAAAHGYCRGHFDVVDGDCVGAGPLCNDSYNQELCEAADCEWRAVH